MVRTWRCRDPAASSGTGDGSWRGPLASPCEHSSNKPGIACAPAWTVLSQQVLLSNKSSHGSEQTSVSISTHYPCLCNHHIWCPSNNFQFPSPLSELLCSAAPSLLFTKQTPLGEVVKLLVQKSYRQKWTILFRPCYRTGPLWGSTQC